MIGRLRGRRSFRELDEQGRRGRSGPLSAVHVPDATSTVARVGYAIPRRVGPAVVRNRVRRRLRAEVSELAALEPEVLLPGSWLIVVRPEAAGLTSAQLRRHLLEAARRAGRPS